MKTKIIISLCALLSLAAVDTARKITALPKVRVTAKVIDENGNPMSGAHVTFVFGEAHDANAIVKVEELTASDGLFTGEGYSGGTYGASITKTGFYQCGLGAAPVTGIVDGRWQPWDETYATTLRSIGNPVQLFAKHVQTEIPMLDQPCGYDLEKGDWVSPYGKGKNSDLTFTVKRDYKDWFNFTVTAEVTFSQPFDGLVRMKSPAYARYSSFRWERAAPETGYTAPHAIRFVNHDPKTGQAPERTFDTTKDREQGYFFRVRTVAENGKIIAANYGKITGDIAIDPRDAKTCTILFTYYLNPTSLDRNMEWDPKRNLIPGLSWEENPREP